MSEEITASPKSRRLPVWIWFYLAFMVLFTAWFFLFRAAYHNQPQTVPLEHLVSPPQAVSKP